MHNYNVQYKKLITEEVRILPRQMVRSKFYRIKEYHTVDGIREKYSEFKTPIIFTLYVSVPKDIVHAIKLSEIRPDLTKRFFGKFVDEDIQTVVMKGTSKAIYNTVINKMPFITNDAYRVYKLSGLKRVSELGMIMSKLTPRDEIATDIDDAAVRDTLEDDEK